MASNSSYANKTPWWAWLFILFIITVFLGLFAFIGMYFVRNTGSGFAQDERYEIN